MLTSIEIQRFKCFERLQLRFGKLTLLSGYNGAGKSSAIQPLLLLAQSLRKAQKPTSLSLNGPLVRLGSVGDIVPSGTAGMNVVFALKSETSIFSWELSARAGERHLTVVECAPLEESSNPAEIGALLARLIYIGAVRDGAAEMQPIPNGDDDWRGNVGADGGFAAYWLDRLSDDQIVANKDNSREKKTSVRKALNGLLGTLFPGAEADAQVLSRVSGMSLQFRLSGTGEWKRPSNVGYGLSYAFPILVALLTAVKGQTVVVDSPEAHLHPAAQSKMGAILAQFAAAGVQVIVETHSDHLLNGARIAVHEGRLAPSDVEVHFFSGASEEGHGVISPIMDATGRLSQWPNGFFDQFDKDVLRLLERL